MMFKTQCGKFSKVLGTSKDKRNQETPLSKGNSLPKKLLKYYLTTYNGTYYQEKIPLLFPADGDS